MSRESQRFCFFNCCFGRECSPVLVESSAAVLAQVLSKDSLESSQALWCINVANSANNDHWWSLDDGDSLDGLLLVQSGAQLVDITNNVGHTSLVANESSQMNWLAWIILWEGLAFTTNAN